MDSEFYIFHVLSWTFFLACLWFLAKAYFSRLHLVQQMSNLPSLKLRFYHLIGHLHILLPYVLKRSYLNISLPVYGFNAFIGLHTIFSNKNLVSTWLCYKPVVTVYKADSTEMILNHSTELKKAWLYEFLHSWLGKGLLTSEGDMWRIRRKMLTSAFHFNILKDFLHAINKQSNIFTDVLQKYTRDEFVDITSLTTKCSFDIMCETIFGTEMDAQTQPINPYLESIIELSVAFFKRLTSAWYWNNFIFNISPSGRKYAKHVKIIHDFTDKLISEKKKEQIARRQNSVSIGGEREEDGMSYGKRKKLALIDLLLEEHLINNSLSEKDIREEVNTFSFGGHDTIAISMSWCIYLIGLHPWIQEKIHEELDSIFGDDDRDATVEDLKDMKYLECVIKEAFRLYPAVPGIGRMIQEDIHFQGKTIPKGCTVCVLTYLLHRDPEVFPNPEKFDPERFTAENSIGRHPYAYVPFSAGPRNCIGQRFAMMEGKTVLSTILRKFKFRSLDPRDRILFLAELMLRPVDALRIQVRKREQNFDFHSVYYFP